MNKLIPILLFVILLVGCSPGSIQSSNPLPPSNQTVTPSDSTTAPPPTDVVHLFNVDPDVVPPVDTFWINPAKVTVSNLSAGAEVSTMASGEQLGIQIHNSGRTVESKRVTNVINDPEVVITLNDYMYELSEDEAIYWNLLDDPKTSEVEPTRVTMLGGKYYLVKVVSEINSENLVPTRYDPNTRQLTVYGLTDPAPGVLQRERIVSVVYVGVAPRFYQVVYATPTSLPAGTSLPPVNAEDWVKIGSNLILMQTFDTVVVPISMFVPEDAVIPQEKWEFWVLVREAETGSGSVALQIEYRSRWIINMKQD